MFRKLKKYLPKSLLGRTLMILVLPTLLAQMLSVYMFYERHWDNVSRKLAESLSNESALIYHQAKSNEDYEQLKNMANFFAIHPEITYSKNVAHGKLLNDAYYTTSLRRGINADFQVYRIPDVVVTVIALGDDKYLKLYASDKRLFNSTTYIFIFWMTGSTTLLLLISVIFLKNQIRPIIKLARLANNFGRGRMPPEGTKPEGAREVKQATLAVMNMMERIKRYVNQRTEMLAGISHDLRTPLTRMKLELEMLRAKTNDENIDELTADVAEMERMVNSYIEFVRGDELEQSSEIDLKELLEESASKYKKLKIKISTKGNLKLLAKPNSLKRAFVNLLDNAERYAKNMSIKASIEMNYAQIVFDDDGTGIPKDKREDVFKPFFRIENSRNPETGGTGLGLSIVRDIINNHGGVVELSDSPKKGLRVVIKLPV